MTTVLIVVLLVILLLVGVSIALGRRTEEVEAARDTEYLELDGAYIRYNVLGGGPPVLLVHGWLSSSRVWEALAGRLAQRFTVYTLDLEGFGESDKPISGYGVRYGSRLLYAFCAHFGLTRTSVVGHDVGGAMAAKLAADHPDVVGRLVLVSTPADEDQIDLPTPLWLATIPVIGALFYTLGRVFRPMRALWLRPFVVDPDDLTEEVIDDAGMSTPAAVHKTLSVTRREISGGRLARQARIIKVPMLLIAGEEDQIVDPQSVGSWARTADQAEVCLIDDCGHLPMIERTAEFNAQILAFLTGDARYLDYVVERREEEAAADEDLADESYADHEGVEDEGFEDAPVRDERPERGLGRLLGRGWRTQPEEPLVPPREDPEISASEGGTLEDGDDSDEATVDLPLRRNRREPPEDRAQFDEPRIGEPSPNAPFQSSPFEVPSDEPRIEEPPSSEPPRGEPAFEASDRSEGTPGIHRRYGDRFVRENPDEASTNGMDEPVVGGDAGDGRGTQPPFGEDDTGYERERRRTEPWDEAEGNAEDPYTGRVEGGMVPEIPRDLFKWPEAWQEYRPGEGSRRRRSGDDVTDDADGPTEGPTEQPPPDDRS